VGHDHHSSPERFLIFRHENLPPAISARVHL